jgi:hypothetical protein
MNMKELLNSIKLEFLKASLPDKLAYIFFGSFIFVLMNMGLGAVIAFWRFVLG